MKRFICFGIVLLKAVLEGDATVISDDRIRSLDAAPVLGRGFNNFTNIFHSTCVDFDPSETTLEKSYECEYY